MTYEEATAVVKETAAQLDTTLTVGYIGNVWHAPYRDDRDWMVWFNDLRRGEPLARYSNVPCLHLGPTEWIEEMTGPRLRALIVDRFDDFQRRLELVAV